MHWSYIFLALTHWYISCFVSSKMGSPIHIWGCLGPAVTYTDERGRHWSVLIAKVESVGLMTQVESIEHCQRISYLVLMENNISTYCKVSKTQQIQNPHLILKLSLPNPLKPGVKSRMKMQLEQCRQAMLQLHLSDQQLYCLLRCTSC